MERNVIQCGIGLKYFQDVALARFSLLQLLDESQITVLPVVDDTCNFAIGIICIGSEDVEKVRRVLSVLDCFGSYYETDLDERKDG